MKSEVDKNELQRYFAPVISLSDQGNLLSADEVDVCIKKIHSEYEGIMQEVVRAAFIAGAKWGTELDIYIANEDAKYYLPVVHKAASEYLKGINRASGL